MLRILRARGVDLAWAVTAVTRAPRNGETAGRDHHYMAESEFLTARAQGQFLETAQVYGRWYGTPLREVVAPLRAGRDVVLRVDVQGARGLHARYPAIITVFIAPPSAEEAARRLQARSTESVAEIARRLHAMQDYELAFAAEADYVIPSITGAQDRIADQMWAVVTAERLRARPRRLDPNDMRPALDG